MQGCGRVVAGLRRGHYGANTPDRQSRDGCGQVRERDSSGRPRNARPRDGLGRPLPRGSVGVEPVPDELSLPPAEALGEAQRLLDAGLPFHAHEVLEAAWKQAPEAERDLWQGLAQLAVGLTHVLRGNPTGAAALLRRGRARIEPFAAAPPHQIDVTGLLDWAQGLLAAVDLSAVGDRAADLSTPPSTPGQAPPRTAQPMLLRSGQSGSSSTDATRLV